MKCLNINNVPSELYKRETLSGKVQLKSPKSVWVSCHGVWLFLLYQLLCGRGVLISMSRWRATFTSRWNTSEEDIIPIHEVDTIFVLTNVAQISNVIVSDFFLRLVQMTPCLFGSKMSDWFRLGWSAVARSNSSRFMILLCLILARPISATLTNFAKYLTKKLETELYSDLIWIPLVRMERPRGAAKFRQTTTGAQLRRKREERGQVSFTLHQITHPSHSCQPQTKPPFSCTTFSDHLFFMRQISRARRCPWVTTRGSSLGTWTTTTQVRGPVLGPTFADLGQLSGIERARRGAEVELNSIELELKTDSELKTRRWRCGRWWEKRGGGEKRRRRREERQLGEGGRSLSHEHSQQVGSHSYSYVMKMKTTSSAQSWPSLKVAIVTSQICWHWGSPQSGDGD